MHTLKDIRNNISFYKKKFGERNTDINIEELIDLDKENRDLIQKKEKLEQEKKLLSKTKDPNNFDKSKKITTEINNFSKKIDTIKKKINELLFNLPNISLDDVPIGKDEKQNKLIKKEGKIKNFSFKIKSHIELGLRNDLLDFETSVKLSGSRFSILKGNFVKRLIFVLYI